MPFQITEEYIEQNEELDLSDVGKWVVVLNGVLMFCDSEKVARNLEKRIRDERPSISLLDIRYD